MYNSYCKIYKKILQKMTFSTNNIQHYFSITVTASIYYHTLHIHITYAMYIRVFLSMI